MTVLLRAKVVLDTVLILPGDKYFKLEGMN
jgi:hypothetical protein